MEAEVEFDEGSSIVGGGTLNCLSCAALISTLFLHNILHDGLNIKGTFTLGSVQFPAGSITFQLDSAQYGPYLPYVANFNQSGSSVVNLVNNSPLDLNLTVSNYEFAVCVSSMQFHKLIFFFFEGRYIKFESI